MEAGAGTGPGTFNSNFLSKKSIPIILNSHAVAIWNFTWYNLNQNFRAFDFCIFSRKFFFLKISFLITSDSVGVKKFFVMGIFRGIRAPTNFCAKDKWNSAVTKLRVLNNVWVSFYQKNFFRFEFILKIIFCVKLFLVTRVTRKFVVLPTEISEK